jgi:DNA gyrase subunit A
MAQKRECTPAVHLVATPHSSLHQSFSRVRMKDVKRPDLSHADPGIRAYVEALEAEVNRLQTGRKRSRSESVPSEPSEPPTTLNVITISNNGLAKRTPRHHYARQRRAGMGVFDLETGNDDHAAVLGIADENQHLLLFSNFGRAFRLPVNALVEASVRDRGQSLAQLLPFRSHERVVAVLPDGGGEYVVLVSQRGWVRRVRGNYLGRSLIPGMSFHDVKEGGYLTAACWTIGDGDLFLVTRQGKAIRFAESQVPGRGCRGMRVHVDDGVAAIAAVYPDSGVFLLGDDGKGTIRLMTGFSANKAPGAAGKIAMKSDHLAGAVAVEADDDILIVSRLNKLIRFSAAEVPPKTGVVQGVTCMSLRGDRAIAVTKAGEIANS